MKPPNTIICEATGREYIPEAEFCERFMYKRHDLPKLRRDGLPCVMKKVRGTLQYFYNVEDCHSWHRGE